MKRLFFSIITALGFISGNYITFEYVCNYPERGPKFYGFPFVQQTDTTWVFSMSGELYVFGFLGNLIFWGFIIGAIAWFLDTIKEQFVKKMMGVFGWIVVVAALLNSYVNLAAIDWRLKLSHDNFKMNYYQTDIPCERHLVIPFKSKN